MKKLLFSIFFLTVLFIFSSATAFAGGVVKPYLVIPQDWKERTDPDISRLKQNILTGLNLSQKFYLDKVGRTFSYDSNVAVVYAEGSIQDNYGTRNCVGGHFEELGLIPPPPDLKIPANILDPPQGYVSILFVVGTGELNSCANANPTGEPRGTAFINHTTLEALGSGDPSWPVSQVTHELGHTFSLSYGGWANGHSCSVLSPDQCKDEFRSKILPPASDCLDSVMGGAGGYCRDESGKQIRPDLGNIGFDNSEFNPEIHTLQTVAFLDPSYQALPLPSPVLIPSPVQNPTPSPFSTPTPTPTPSPTVTNPNIPPGKVPYSSDLDQGCRNLGGTKCFNSIGNDSIFQSLCTEAGGISIGQGQAGGCYSEEQSCCKFVTSCDSLNGQCTDVHDPKFMSEPTHDRVHGYCLTDLYDAQKSGDESLLCWNKPGQITLTPTPSPTIISTPTPSPSASPTDSCTQVADQTCGYIDLGECALDLGSRCLQGTGICSNGHTCFKIAPSTPTPSPTYSVTQIKVSNYENFGLNTVGDEGSSTQTFSSPTTQITWNKSTLNPSSSIFIAPINSDGTSGVITSVNLSNGQIYPVPNSPFVITAKIVRKIVKISINDGQSVREINSDFAQVLSVHLPGTVGTDGTYPIILGISYNDGSSKSLIFKFNYSLTGSASPTVSTPTPSISTDEAVCNAKGGVCQTSCQGTKFSAQVGTCASKGQLCCATPVTAPSPSASKCPGEDISRVGVESWGTSCKPGDPDKVQAANNNTACTVASCFLNPKITPNEYCWYNSGASYGGSGNYESCKAKGVTITTPTPTPTPVASAIPASFSKTGPCYQPGYDSNICGTNPGGAGGQCDSLGQQSSPISCTKTCPDGSQVTGTSVSTCGVDGCYTNSCSCNASCN